MGFIIVAVLLIALVSFIPQLWVRAILRRHQHPHLDLPGDAKTFTQHLINKYQLQNVTLHCLPEHSKQGDHYDPLTKSIHLSFTNFNSNSLTAIVTAAHEFGHALQHHDHYEPLLQRTNMVLRAQWLQKFSGAALVATPILIPLLHTPMIGFITFAAGFIAMGIPVLIHLSTLPVEFDASYNRALPILKEGGYLNSKDLSSARHILTACAFTYVTASLASLFNLWRWFSGWRR